MNNDFKILNKVKDYISKNNKICCYKDDFNIYKKYNNISYIIVKDNKIIKKVIKTIYMKKVI